MTTRTTKTTRTTPTKKPAKLPRSRILLALALAPFALIAIGGRVLVPWIAIAMTRHLAAVASWMRMDLRVAENARPRGADPGGPPGFTAVPPARAAASTSMRPPKERAERPPARAYPRGPAAIFISSERLLRLAPNQLRGVGAATIVDGPGRRAGVSLSGVAALGVGLSDGDVVTSIGGRPTPTADDAMAAGIAAWSAGVRSVHATIVRGDETIAVTVEIPKTDASY